MKRGRLFLLLIGMPFILDILIIFAGALGGYSFEEMEPFIIGVSCIYCVVLLAWFYGLGLNLYKKCPDSARPSILTFRIAFIAQIVSAVFIYFRFGQDGPAPMPTWMVAFMPVAAFCALYIPYFIAKALKTAQMQRPVSFGDYAGEFFGMIYFPIGLWYIQPKINKLFGPEQSGRPGCPPERHEQYSQSPGNEYRTESHDQTNHRLRMKFFLTLKHWQLFLLLFGLTFALMIATRTVESMKGYVGGLSPYDTGVMILYCALLLGWFYSLAVNLHKRLPPQAGMSLTRFRIMFFFPLVFFGSGFLLRPTESDSAALALLIVLGSFFSMYCIFYVIYFIAKEIKTVELQQRVTFGDYAGEFFGLWFSPIGIWYIQPKINNLFTNKE